jgi:hypothetical protein
MWVEANQPPFLSCNFIETIMTHPHTLHHKPQTSNPKPQTPNPKLQTPNPKPQPRCRCYEDNVETFENHLPETCDRKEPAPGEFFFTTTPMPAGVNYSNYTNGTHAAFSDGNGTWWGNATWGTNATSGNETSGGGSATSPTFRRLMADGDGYADGYGDGYSGDGVPLARGYSSESCMSGCQNRDEFAARAQLKAYVRPTPGTLNPKLLTLHPTPETLIPEP